MQSSLINANKQHIGEQIELYTREGLSYLEATSRWLEENGIPPFGYTKYVPSIVIDKIKEESQRDNLLRPSMTTSSDTGNNLDFMYEL